MIIRVGYSLEGPFDYRVVPLLLARLAVEVLGPEVSIEHLPPPSGRVRRGYGLIAHLPADALVLRELGADVFVAVVDTDDTRVASRLTALREAREKAQPSPLCFALGVAVRSVEAWLLADEQAIRAALREHTYGEIVVPRQPSPETIARPKEHLDALFSDLTSGIEPGASRFAEAIAAGSDLRTLRDRCPHFDALATEFINCLRQTLGARPFV